MTINKKSLGKLLVIIIIFSCHNLSAQQGFILLSAGQAVDSAIKNHQLYIISQLQLQQIKAQKGTAVNFEPLEVNYKRGQINSPAVDNYFEIYQDFGSPLEHYRRSCLIKQEANVAEHNSEIVRKNLIVNVKSIYYQWIYQHSKLLLARDKKDLYKDYLKISNLHYKTGNFDIIEKTQAETRFYKVEMEHQIALDELRVIENKLKGIASIEGDIYPENQQIAIYQMIAPPDSGKRFSASIITDYYQHKAKASDLAVKYEKAKYFPSVSAGYFHQEINNVKGFNGWQAGIVVPLWIFPVKSKVQQAKIQQQIDQAYYQYQQKTSEQTINKQVLELEKLYRRVAYYNKSGLQQSDVLIKTLKLKYEKEEIEYFEYIRGMEEALDIQLEYIEALNNYNQKAIDLEFYSK